jgi:hypothetical protein
MSPTVLYVVSVTFAKSKLATSRSRRALIKPDDDHDISKSHDNDVIFHVLPKLDEKLELAT